MDAFDVGVASRCLDRARRGGVGAGRSSSGDKPIAAVLRGVVFGA